MKKTFYALRKSSPVDCTITKYTDRKEAYLIAGIAKQRKEDSFCERKIFVRKEHFITIVIDI